VRLISDEGGQIGIVGIREAQEIAEERGLDLVEVAPNANPPVCRLMDYGKFRYEQSKKEREARKHQKQTELKEVRLKPKTSSHDLQVKAKRARRFLLAGDKVKFTVRFRGREMAHTNIGREMLDEVIESLRDIAVVEQKPTQESRALSVTLAPDAKTLKAAQDAQRAQSRQRRQEKAASRAQPNADAQDDTDDEELEEEELEEEGLYDVEDHDDDDQDDEDHDDDDQDDDDQDDEDHDDDDQDDEDHDDDQDDEDHDDDQDDDDQDDDEPAARQRRGKTDRDRRDRNDRK
jgi:translation initiation factor IF-3